MPRHGHEHLRKSPLDSLSRLQPGPLLTGWTPTLLLLLPCTPRTRYTTLHYIPHENAILTFLEEARRQANPAFQAARGGGHRGKRPGQRGLEWRVRGGAPHALKFQRARRDSLSESFPSEEMPCNQCKGKSLRDSQKL